MKSALSQLELIESTVKGGMRAVNRSLDLDVLVNEVFERLNKYKPEVFELEGLDEDMTRYLNRVGRNVALDHLERQRKAHQFEQRATGRMGAKLFDRPHVRRAPSGDVAPDPAEIVEKREVYYRALDCISRLPPHAQRYMIRFASGETKSQIARAEGVSRQAVGKAIKQAISDIRNEIDDIAEEDK